MAQKRKARPKKKSPKTFRFELGWSGLAGVTVTVLCLLAWMFMFGVWAGQTVLLPPNGSKVTAALQKTKPKNAQGVRPHGKKIVVGGS